MLHATGKPEKEASIFSKVRKLTPPSLTNYLHLVYMPRPYVHCKQNAPLECVAIDKNIVILHLSGLSAE